MINQYSFVVIAVVLISTISPLVWRLVGGKYAIAAVVLLVLFVVAFQLIFQTDSAKDSTLHSFEESIVSGSPVLLVLYSNF